jgi:hypothetical protein
LAVLGLVGLVWVAAGACGGEISEPGSTGGAAAASGGRTGSGAEGGVLIDAAGPTIDGPSGGFDAGSTASCNVPSDCAWGEISREILVSADCPCLYGCVYLPLNRTTVDRRQQQYAALCTPGYDGLGRSCGIDDCIMPPALLCIQGQCMGAE